MTALPYETLASALVVAGLAAALLYLLGRDES